MKYVVKCQVNNVKKNSRLNFEFCYSAENMESIFYYHGTNNKL